MRPGQQITLRCCYCGTTPTCDSLAIIAVGSTTMRVPKECLTWPNSPMIAEVHLVLTLYTAQPDKEGHLCFRLSNGDLTYLKPSELTTIIED